MQSQFVTFAKGWKNTELGDRGQKFPIPALHVQAQYLHFIPYCKASEYNLASLSSVTVKYHVSMGTGDTFSFTFFFGCWGNTGD